MTRTINEIESKSTKLLGVVNDIVGHNLREVNTSLVLVSLFICENEW